MKKNGVILLLFSLLLLSGCKSKKSAEIKKFNLAEIYSENYPVTLADYDFARIVSEKSEGKIQLNVIPDGGISSDESSVLKMMQEGSLAFARVSAALVANYFPKLNVIMLPYLYRDSDHFWNVLTGNIGESFLSEISENAEFTGLCYFDSGARSFYTAKEIHSVADMAGLRIRMPENQMLCDMLSQFGAAGVTRIAESDTYSAVRNGIVDGAEGSLQSYYSLEDYKAAFFYIKNEHCRIPDVLLISRAALSSLSQKEIQIVKDAAKQAAEFEVSLWKKNEAEAEENLAKEGVTVIKPGEKELFEFKQRVQPLYIKYAGDYPEIIEEIKKTK